MKSNINKKETILKSVIRNVNIFDNMRLCEHYYYYCAKSHM